MKLPVTVGSEGNPCRGVGPDPNPNPAVQPPGTLHHQHKHPRGQRPGARWHLHKDSEGLGTACKGLRVPQVTGYHILKIAELDDG